MDVEAYEAAGLLDCPAEAREGRLELLEHLAALGLSVDQMREAGDRGSLHAAGSDAMIRPGTHRGIEEIATSAGVSAQLIRRVLQAAGISAADDDFRESDEETFRLFGVGTAIFGEEATLRFTRTIGAALASIADAAMSLFLVEVEDPVLRSGVSELERALGTEEATASLAVIPGAMDGLFRFHIEHAIARQRASTEYGSAPGMFRLAVGFVDLVGFTTLARDLDPAALGDLIQRFEMTANEVVSREGGRVVKHIGDEVMFTTTEPAAAARSALELVARFDDSVVAPHAGISFGAVLGRGGDFYGPIVNLASRIADIAVPNEILVSDAMATAIAGGDGFAVAPAGRRMLKGFDEPVELFTLS